MYKIESKDGKWILHGATSGERLKSVSIRFPEMKRDTAAGTVYVLAAPATATIEIEFPNGQAKSFTDVPVTFS
jgi:hypothetical protein